MISIRVIIYKVVASRFWKKTMV